MGRDNAIGGLPVSIELNRLAMASENPTIEVLVKVVGGELSMIGMGDMTTEDPGHTWIALQWGDQVHEPHAIRWDGVLGDESDVLPSGKLHSQVAGAPMAEILLANPVEAESFVLRKRL